MKKPQSGVAVLSVLLIFTLLAGCDLLLPPDQAETEPPAGDQEQGEPSGPSDSRENDSQVPPGGEDTSDPGGSGDSNLKPVGFVNNGSIAATVSAWTYLPLGTDTPETPSDASTVSFPPNSPGLWPNSSRFLSLPMGTYTWCYWWELGDINDDGVIEYAHAFDDRQVLLDQNDSDDLELAESVDLSVPPPGGIFPGQCDREIQVIRFGDDYSEYRVEIQAGLVVGGGAMGSDNVPWTITAGTFDGEELYFQATHEDDAGCNDGEFWFVVGETSVTRTYSRGECGDEWDFDLVFDRRE